MAVCITAQKILSGLRVRGGAFPRCTTAARQVERPADGGGMWAPGPVSGSVPRGDRQVSWASDSEAGAPGCQREHASLEWPNYHDSRPTRHLPESPVRFPRVGA